MLDLPRCCCLKARRLARTGPGLVQCQVQAKTKRMPRTAALKVFLGEGWAKRAGDGSWGLGQLENWAAGAEEAGPATDSPFRTGAGPQGPGTSAASAASASPCSPGCHWGRGRLGLGGPWGALKPAMRQAAESLVEVQGRNLRTLRVLWALKPQLSEVDRFSGFGSLYHR